MTLKSYPNDHPPPSASLLEENVQTVAAQPASAKVAPGRPVVRPIVLLILDGFGYREEIQDNAIAQARKPNFDRLWATHPHTLINASEHYVGLPDGQMGNSEVGHLNIGAGRVVYQDFERINQSISTGEFFRIPLLVDAIEGLKKTGKALHIFGLLSDGGVHSHEDHIHAMAEMAVRYQRAEHVEDDAGCELCGVVVDIVRR